MNRLCLLALGVLLFSGCAHQEPPPGGPVDRTPPEVVDHFPPAGARQVPLDGDITVTFSEGMDRSSVTDAVFISPAPKEPPRLKWKGRTLKVSLADSLEQDQTYVITLGVGCKDYHNNNLAESYSFAFCTGERIDQGLLQGRVFENITPRMGVDLWAYQLRGDLQPDPLRYDPDYVTQTDTQGRFQLSHLREGRYRLFAVDDRNGDRKFQADEELIGVPDGDVLISIDELVVRTGPLRLTRLDTLGPALQGVEVPHGGAVVLLFDQPMDSALAVDLRNYGIRTQRPEEDSLDIRVASLGGGRGERVILSTSPQRDGVKYRLSVTGLKDLAGNPLAPIEDRAEFVGSGQPDTTGPRLVDHWPADSARGLLTDVSIVLDFDEAMEAVSVETSLVVSDSAGGPLDGQFRWSHGAAAGFFPDQGLKLGEGYSVSLRAAGVRDLAGNAMQDTSVVIWFRTADADVPGSLSGQVHRGGFGDSSRVFLQMHGLDGDDRLIGVTTETQQYLFGELPPGRYVLSAFLDLDGNGRFDFGHPVPFTPAEPFWVGEDTLRVRSRWETAEVEVSFQR